MQLRDPAEQREHGVARAHAERRERVGHAVGLLFELAVRQLAPRVVLSEPDQRGLVTERAGRVPGDRLVRDVEAAAGEAVERVAGGRPA